MDLETYSRRAIMAKLSKYCHFADEHSFIEITEWHNREGFDITINSKRNEKNISLTDGELEAIKKLTKKLYKFTPY